MMEIPSLEGARYEFDVYDEGSEKILGLSSKDQKSAGNQLTQIVKTVE